MGIKFNNWRENRLAVFGRMFVLSLAACILFACGVQAAAPSVLAESAILINARTGAVIFEKNADIRRAPASMTKMMTCILCLETKGLNAEFKVTQAAAATEDSYLEMKGGERLLSGELLQEMMMESDNGAAVVVAQNVSGSVLKFADLMNEKAKEIGCRKTHFSNPNGLTAKWHYSTARDMSKIAAYCMKNPDFRNLVSKKNAVIHWASPAGRTYKSETTNELLGRYSGANGIKTGWTNAARGCVAASAKRGDVELIAVVMKSKDHDTRFSDARKLLDYGFSVGGEGKIVAEDSVTVKSKRLPDVSRPGASPKRATVLAASPAPKAVATPAVTSAPKTTGTPAVSSASEANAGPVATAAPAAKNTGIRMPVVRRPGA